MSDTEILEVYKEEVLGLQKFPDTDWVLKLFRYQANSNEVYKNYLKLLQIDPLSIDTIEAIPFLPIELFKNHTVKSGKWIEEEVFTSSGTTSSQTSKHHLYSSLFYKKHSQHCFEHFYGPLEEYCVLALLPAYLERKGSSLVYMADHFIKTSKDTSSGFFLHNWEDLVKVLMHKKQQGVKTLLLGVSFALLDFAEQYKLDLSHVVVMETGGMKGRRKEMPRAELHAEMSGLLHLKAVHSEYGMTELLSQSYSLGEGLFELPPSMQFVIRDMTDPFSLVKSGKSGVLNIIDLANFATCSFIETADLARRQGLNGYEILGRLDRAMVRGCNLLYTG